jgi:hypothetical protein
MTQVENTGLTLTYSEQVESTVSFARISTPLGSSNRYRKFFGEPDASSGCAMVRVNDKHRPEKEQLESGAEEFTRCDVLVGGCIKAFSETDSLTIRRGWIPQRMSCTGKMITSCQPRTRQESRQTHQVRRNLSSQSPSRTHGHKLGSSQRRPAGVFLKRLTKARA